MLRNLGAFVLLLGLAACHHPNKSVPVQPEDAGYQNLLNKKKEMGVEFYAIGQEPGWGLDMDMERGFSFKSYDGTTINTPPVEGVRAADANVTRYHAFVELGELDFTIQQAPCQDLMSGRKYTHTVWGRVKIGNGPYKEYKGCGSFLST